MIATKPVNILHFEDQKSIQSMVQKKIANELHGKVKSWDNLHSLKYYAESKHFYGRFTAIICDIMFPNLDAYHCLEDLMKLAMEGKPIIFYSCIDEDDFEREAKKVLNLDKLPENFKYVQKASKNNLSKICDYIKEVI